jgi:hypothetical protein
MAPPIGDTVANAHASPSGDDDQRTSACEIPRRRLDLIRAADISFTILGIPRDIF